MIETRSSQWRKNTFRGWTCVNCGVKVKTVGEKLVHQRKGCDNSLDSKICINKEDYDERR